MKYQKYINYFLCAILLAIVGTKVFVKEKTDTIPVKPQERVGQFELSNDIEFPDEGYMKLNSNFGIENHIKGNETSSFVLKFDGNEKVKIQENKIILSPTNGLFDVYVGDERESVGEKLENMYILQNDARIRSEEFDRNSYDLAHFGYKVDFTGTATNQKNIAYLGYGYESIRGMKQFDDFLLMSVVCPGRNVGKYGKTYLVKLRKKENYSIKNPEETLSSVTSNMFIHEVVQLTPNNRYFREFHRIGDTYIGVRANNGVWTSTNNATTWNPIDYTTNFDGICMDCSKTAVIFGHSNGMHRAEINWKTKEIKKFIPIIGQTNTIRKLAFGELNDVKHTKIWIAGGDDDNGILVSKDDGITWKNSSITNGRFRSLFYKNGVFYAGTYCSKTMYSNKDIRGIWRSTDGENWENVYKNKDKYSVSGNRFYSITYANGMFLAIGTYEERYIYYSLDGINWDKILLPINGALSMCGYDGGIFIGSAENGFWDIKLSKRLASSVIYSKDEINAMLLELKKEIVKLENELHNKNGTVSSLAEKPITIENIVESSKYKLEQMNSDKQQSIRKLPKMFIDNYKKQEEINKKLEKERKIKLLKEKHKKELEALE